MLGIDCFGKTIYFMWPESEGKEFKTSPEVTINFTDPHSLLKQLSLSTFLIEGEIDDSSSWFIKHYLKWCISRFFSDGISMLFGMIKEKNHVNDEQISKVL